MKTVSKILYSLKQGIKGVFHNKTMSFISTMSVTASLIILGIVLTIVLNINQFINSAKDEINEVRVEIKSDLDDDARIELKTEMDEIEGINNIEFKTKETSFNEMKKSWGEDAYLLDGVDNPLEDCYILTIDNPNAIKSISNKILKFDGVLDVKYHQDVMQNFLNISNTVIKFGGLLILGLLLICLVIISNTIKSRVYSKKEEIQIIKYVGASNRFVIAPFIVEGFIIGFLGSVLSIGICIGMYSYILDKIREVISTIMGGTVLPLASISLSLISVLAITGILVGVLGSAISVKKHLKV
ncbi:permease-like cell division protein FtsX [Romboutsia lituseburensis]|uniref:Cell division protein FtsX n=1 Tax=Romboutsia lituseburensis DSM 797 TaxID=1121325 RepID=A0A1G9P3G8_9FIRM|nr:permease-like cell division protein FtsX [Romboutsia lituseburensis]CEH33230.1 Cell-division protein [Romboutsia lituseburensis]SDL93378.1 cell division protein FtsX [Romboutsia lituseburensis DSM 797]